MVQIYLVLYNRTYLNVIDSFPFGQQKKNAVPQMYFRRSHILETGPSDLGKPSALLSALQLAMFTVLQLCNRFCKLALCMYFSTIQCSSPATSCFPP